MSKQITHWNKNENWGQIALRRERFFVTEQAYGIFHLGYNSPKGDPFDLVTVKTSGLNHKHDQDHRDIPDALAREAGILYESYENSETVWTDKWECKRQEGKQYDEAFLKLLKYMRVPDLYVERWKMNAMKEKL